MPSAPRGFQLTPVQEDPPLVSVSWQAPRHPAGTIEGYKLSYSQLGENQVVEERRFDGEKLKFTTGFLGISEYFLVFLDISRFF